MPDINNNSITSTITEAPTTTEAAPTIAEAPTTTAVTTEPPAATTAPSATTLAALADTPAASPAASPATAPPAPPKKDTQSRKYLITINNPQEKGFTHDHIKEVLSNMKSVIYWCLADEIGGETQTYHTHLFIACKTPMRFSTVQNRFPGAHIDQSLGSSQENRDYVRKEGRHAEEKGSTSVPGTFEEWGTLPDDSRCGQNQMMKSLYEMVSNGMSDYEIISRNPDYIPMLDKIKQVRLTIDQERSKNDWRDLEVVYTYGATGLGKTKGVMETFGYGNVFRVTDYIHPFDTYEGQDVILFEEFASSVRIQEMLNYLDGYPLKLPARYSDKQACYTRVFLTSNLSLEKQYQNIQYNEPQVWEAFLRRIHKVRVYHGTDQYTEYATQDYLNRFQKIDPKDTPFAPERKPSTKKNAYHQERMELTSDVNYHTPDAPPTRQAVPQPDSFKQGKLELMPDCERLTDGVFTECKESPFDIVINLQKGGRVNEKENAESN